MQPEIIEKNLDRFECQRCQECCRQPGFVSLTSEDVREAAAFLSLDEFEFANQYCEVVDRRRLVLKKKNGEECIFLAEDGCSIHPAKPAQCRDFPGKWRTPKSFSYCVGLRILANSR